MLVGIAAAGLGILLMQGVAACEFALDWLRVRPVLRPALGGLLVGVLSSGHGALHISSALAAPLSAIALLLVLKSLAAIVTLGTGFRGGLFFASLLIGALGGRISPMRCGPPARSIRTAMRSEVIGLLSEAYALRWYSGELEQRRQEILGE